MTVRVRVYPGPMRAPRHARCLVRGRGRGRDRGRVRVVEVRVTLTLTLTPALPAASSYTQRPG